MYEGELSELEPEFVGMRYDDATVIGLAFMGVLDKCGFQGKVGTTDALAYEDPILEDLMSGATVPPILSDPD